MKYEGNMTKHGNFSTFFPGGLAYFVRLFAICYVSSLILDYYHEARYVAEFWAPARYTAPTGIDFDIHDPFTMAFHKGVVSYHTEAASFTKSYNPDAKTPIKNA
jgi:hypothetical protein